MIPHTHTHQDSGLEGVMGHWKLKCRRQAGGAEKDNEGNCDPCVGVPGKSGAGV